jgi:hypothetical protein
MAKINCGALSAAQKLFLPQSILGNRGAFAAVF